MPIDRRTLSSRALLNRSTHGIVIPGDNFPQPVIEMKLQLKYDTWKKKWQLVTENIIYYWDVTSAAEANIPHIGKITF